MSIERPNFDPSSPPQKQNDLIKSEQGIMWEKIRAEVDKITDALGRGIDDKIKETVTAFRIHEFTTNQSCEGHIDDKEMDETPFPWVEINIPEPEGWKEATGKKKEEIEQEWTIENLEQQRKMMRLLAEFYQDRKVPFDVRLTFDRSGTFGGFRIQGFGAEIMKLLSPEEQHKKLISYRKEMNDFTNFLKDKYF